MAPKVRHSDIQRSVGGMERRGSQTSLTHLMVGAVVVGTPTALLEPVSLGKAMAAGHPQKILRLAAVVAQVVLAVTFRSLISSATAVRGALVIPRTSLAPLLDMAAAVVVQRLITEALAVMEAAEMAATPMLVAGRTGLMA
jgi:hypothetical protein